MIYHWFCPTPKCNALLGVAHDDKLEFKNKSETTVVEGQDLVARKTCRKCGKSHELRLPKRPQPAPRHRQ